MKTNDANRKGAKLRISEIYASLQGEGLLTGTPSVFLRTSGCNLRCWFCDTPFASWRPEGDFHAADDIVARTLELDLKHVVVTGGEPMIYRSLPEVLRPLHQAGKHVTIETAGTINFAGSPAELPCDLMSISPKLSSSTPSASEYPSWHARHEARRERLDVVRQLMRDYTYQLKFVVDALVDAEEVLFYLERLGQFDADRVLLMPQGTHSAMLARQAEWLMPWCQKHQFRFCPRSHIEWFGNRRGT